MGERGGLESPGLSPSSAPVHRVSTLQTVEWLKNSLSKIKDWAEWTNDYEMERNLGS